MQSSITSTSHLSNQSSSHELIDPSTGLAHLYTVMHPLNRPFFKPPSSHSSIILPSVHPSSKPAIHLSEWNRKCFQLIENVKKISRSMLSNTRQALKLLRIPIGFGDQCEQIPLTKTLVPRQLNSDQGS